MVVAYVVGSTSHLRRVEGWAGDGGGGGGGVT